MVVFTVFWAAGDLNAEQGVSLVLGTTRPPCCPVPLHTAPPSTSASAPSACSSPPGQRASVRPFRAGRPRTT